MAKKKNNNIPRKKKKELKKQLINKAVSSEKYNKKQAEKLSFTALQNEVKKIERNEARQAKRNANREKARAAGIPDSIISKNRLAEKGEKTLNDFISNFIREKEKEQQREHRRELDRKRKEATLLILQGKGYSLDEAKKIYNSGVKSIKKADEYPAKLSADPNEIYTTKDYLCILWFDPANESNLGTALEQARSWNRVQKRNMVRSIDRKAVYKKTTYEKFLGDYALMFGEKSEVEYWFKNKMQVGKRQKKGDTHKVEKYKQICAPRNTFTLKGLEDMMAAMLSALIPERQAAFMNDMAVFIEENIPDIYDTFFK